MLCYLDMTFCREKTCAKFGDKCDRSLTESVLKDADKWWGKEKGGAPVTVFTNKPECYEDKNES